MVFVFEVRYLGWPVPGAYVACIERDDIIWVEPYVEELVGDVTCGGDQDASDASEEIKRRCYCAGGDTPEQALSNLLAMDGVGLYY